MFRRLLYTISLTILCGANLSCLPAWGASIVGNEVTLLHTQSPAQGDNCPNGTYKLTFGATLYSNMVFSMMSTCPTDYRRADFGGPYVIGDTVAVTNPLTPSNPGNCPNGDYAIAISSTMYNNMTFSQNATNCPTSDYRKIKLNGITLGNQDTVCDNGYLKNGSCVSYVSFGYQPGFYNLDLNANTYTDPTNNACASGYHETSTLHPYFEKCMAAGTEIQLNWEGVDVTGTDAASCYYLGDLYAPTTAPTNVPQGYKFLGWLPRQQ